jgi:hypothetical protein
MTDLDKPVKRRSVGTHRKRRFVVILMPGDVIGFREERRRKVYTAPLAAVFDWTLKTNVAAEKAAKKRSKQK